MKSILVVAILFLTSLSYSNTVELGNSGMFKNNLIDAIFGSRILDGFWQGDDGIDCGEPEVEIHSISYQNSKIHFSVDPAGMAHGCEVRSMLCEVSFIETENQTILITDKSVGLHGAGCSLNY